MPEPLTVWVVDDGGEPWGCAGDPLAIFSTREKAEQFKADPKRGGSWCEITAWVVDEEAEDD